MNLEHIVNIDRQLGKLQSAALDNSMTDSSVVDHVNQIRSITSQISYEEEADVAKKTLRQLANELFHAFKNDSAIEDWSKVIKVAEQLNKMGEK